MLRRDILVSACMLLSLGGCSQKSKDFIPTEIQPPPTEPPRVIGQPAPDGTVPEGGQAAPAEKKAPPLKIKSL